MGADVLYVDQVSELPWEKEKVDDGEVGRAATTVSGFVSAVVFALTYNSLSEFTSECLREFVFDCISEFAIDSPVELAIDSLSELTFESVVIHG